MSGAVLVTGATGLIGGAVARSFASEGRRVIAAVRDCEKAAKLLVGVKGVEFVKWDLFSDAGDLGNAGEIDVVIHAASPTSGKFFFEHPVETERMIIEGARTLLNLAVEKKVDAFVFLSSMEAYGSPETDDLLNEDAPFHGNISAPRSSYARGKRGAESLCREYARRFGLRAMSLRLAQTFGALVPKSESRVFAQFLKSALAGDMIRLSSSGSSTRMYLETEDAVSAIRKVIEKGAAGEIYNAANPATYCSLADMARMVSGRFGGAGVSLGRDDDPVNACYPPPHHLRMDVSRLMALGWRPRFGLADAFDRLSASWCCDPAMDSGEM